MAIVKLGQTTPEPVKRALRRLERLARNLANAGDRASARIVDAAMADLRALRAQPSEPQGRPICYGMRKKGETAIIGIIPTKIHDKPATAEWYVENYEEVALYTAPAGNAGGECAAPVAQSREVEALVWTPAEVTPEPDVMIALYIASPNDGGPEIRQGRFDPIFGYVDSTTAKRIEPDSWTLAPSQEKAS